MKIVGAPDYYIRNGKNILLFESKDFLIRADKKASFDYDIYNKEFAKTLYFEELPNGKEKAGAVKQLINSIRNLLTMNFPADTDYNYKDVTIYPIIITHDHQYDTPGFNYFIDTWFYDELRGLREEWLFIYGVKPLVVINIDSLIYFQKGLTENMALHQVLKAYHDHIWIKYGVKFNTFEDSKEYYMNKMIPFSLYLNNLFQEKGFADSPPLLELVAPTLFGAQ